MKDDVVVDLSARYFDALVLLCGSPGELISKDKFHDDVWAGIPVTDDALTQCIRTLRRQLGDNAARPRFIETVPKYGYRFIGSISEDASITGPGDSSPETMDISIRDQLERRLTIIVAAVGGGALAGLIGGIIYGAIGISTTEYAGGLSAFLVILFLTLLVGIVGGGAVGSGLALVPKRFAGGAWAHILGPTLGGATVGAIANLVGTDVLHIVFGFTGGRITGAVEGTLLGLAIGLAVAIDQKRGGQFSISGLQVHAIRSGLIGLTAGALIGFSGGRLMAGTLSELDTNFSGSRLKLDAISLLVHETTFGPLSHLASAMLEGMVFVTCVSTALGIGLRVLRPAGQI